MDKNKVMVLVGLYNLYKHTNEAFGMVDVSKYGVYLDEDVFFEIFAGEIIKIKGCEYDSETNENYTTVDGIKFYCYTEKKKVKSIPTLTQLKETCEKNDKKFGENSCINCEYMEYCDKIEDRMPKDWRL